MEKLELGSSEKCLRHKKQPRVCGHRKRRKPEGRRH